MRDVKVRSVSGDESGVETHAVLDVLGGGGLIPKGDFIFADRGGTQKVARVIAEPETFPPEADGDPEMLRGRYKLELMGLPIAEDDALWAR
jgi:hypothetical protein